MKSLDAHTDAVERQSGEHLHIVVSQVIRVGFKGDFLASLQAIYFLYLVEYTMKIVFRELRGRSASEIEGANGRIMQIVASHYQLLTKRIYITRLHVM